MNKKIKLFLIISTVIIQFLLVSCATLPKTVNPGDTLVIGRVEMNFREYKETEYNGTKYYGTQVFIYDAYTGAEYIASTDKEGYFYAKNLKPNNPYHIKKFKYTTPSGSYIEYKDYFYDFLIPADNKVINLGTYYFFHNQRNNYSKFEIINKNVVREHFLSLNEDSQWLKKEIVDKL